MIKPRNHQHQTLSRFFILLGLIAFGAPVGCNTIEGAGEDVEAAGEAIDDAADED